MQPSISYPSEKTKANLVDKSNELTTHKPLTAPAKPLPKKNRLIILLPPQITDEAGLSRFILGLAQTNDSDVILLMLVSKFEDESIGHIKLSTINAILLGFHFKIDTQIIWGKSWINAIKQFISSGDVIVCPKDLKTSMGLFLQVPLSNQLIRQLTNPVQTYSGFIRYEHFSPWNLIRTIVYWLGIFLIMGCFFWIESKTGFSQLGGVGTFDLILLVIVEIGALYFWSSFLG
jgi:hypothetical protein